MRRIDCSLLCLAMLWLTACAAHDFYSLASPDYPVERKRSGVVIVAVPRETEEGVALAAEARRLLTAELGTRWFNILDMEQLRQSSPTLEPTLDRLARQTLAGAPTDRTLGEELFRRYGLGQLLVVDVYRHEQYWGRETKITRVGVEARLVQLVEGRILWQGRSDPEYSGAPGHGFDAAARRAVHELVRVMNDELPRFKDTPYADWPVLEHFTPN